MSASIALLLVAGLTLGAATSQSASTAPPKDETATQFYLRFRAATQSAKSMDDVTPFWSADLLHEFSMMPEADKASTLEMVKLGESRMAGVKVVKETPTAGGAQLTLEGVGPDRKPMVGTADFVREQGKWKIVEAPQWAPKGS